MRWLSQPVCMLVLLTYTHFALAYEVETHKQLSRKAYSASDLGIDPSVQANLGLQASDKFPDSQGTAGNTIIDLFGIGANFEDNNIRPRNHFYNPLNNQPLTSNGIAFGDTSPDWALEDGGDILLQSNSFKDAHDYLYQALTLPALADRQKNFGLTFQTLGMVVHHIQDMAQPQHVRNDPHMDKLSLWGLNPLFNPSLYERYTDRRDIRANLPFTGYAPAYSSADPATFSAARNFWHTPDGKGLADYTNRGFVSAGTNFIAMSLGTIQSNPDFPSPLGAIAYVTRQQITDPTLLGPQGPGQPLTGEIQFVGTPVLDNVTGALDINERTSTYSIFDPDLISAGKSAVFSLNSFNFKAAQKLLIPRAVGYSAGLINYFFRGKMEISLPDEGVYAIVDHSVEKTIDVSGFRTIKLKLANTTPGEAMDKGDLVAVAKFHRNTCYKEDMSGEYGVPGNDWQHGCRSPEEEIVVSVTLKDTPVSNDPTQPTPLTFDFSKNPIPINASDLYLQVVYKGKLGNEDGAVVVATRDIPEPTFQVVVNGTDYLWLNSTWLTADEAQAAGLNPCGPGGGPLMVCRTDLVPLTVEIGLQGYDPAQASHVVVSPLATIIDLPAGRFSRVALLMDGVFDKMAITATGSGGFQEWLNLSPTHPVINQLTAGGAMSAEPYVHAYGVYYYRDWSDTLESGTFMPVHWSGLSAGEAGRNKHPVLQNLLPYPVTAINFH